MSAHHVARGMPRLFRTYIVRTGEDESYDCTIWQAARATSAFPDLFKPVNIGPSGLEEPFVDGGLGCNNPLDILFEECYTNYPERHVGCVISLGAGQLPPTSALSADSKDALLQMARDCESTENEAALRSRDVPGLYFRFSVPQGMQAIEGDDWEKTAIIKAHTDRYMLTDAVSEQMWAAVRGIGTPQLGKISTTKLRVLMISPLMPLHYTDSFSFFALCRTLATLDLPHSILIA